MAITINIEKQITKFIKPFLSTLPTLRNYKLGFIDEFCSPADVGLVLFFNTNSHENPNFVSDLETSLAKILTRFHPLAGRYGDEFTATVDCSDQGAEFIHATADAQLQDFLASDETVNFIDDFIPLKSGSSISHRDHPLLATQVTIFKCGSVAIGVSATHKIVDASTLCTFVNEWANANANITREANSTEFLTTPGFGYGFNSSSLFPARGLTSFAVPPTNDDTLPKYTRKKVSFSGSFISNMKANTKNNTKCSKVQMVSAIMWKTFINVDTAIHHDHPRKSLLIQAINLREKMASSIPRNSFGNLWGLLATECKNPEPKTEELIDLLTDHVKKTVDDLSKVRHDSEEGQEMVLNSFSSLRSMNPETSSVMIVTSWCKFGFYEADFGFGKPIWVAPGSIGVNRTVNLMDDREGDGVEAYVFLEVNEVPYFDEALEIVKGFSG